jgi:hypothetical protein
MVAVLHQALLLLTFIYAQRIKNSQVCSSFCNEEETNACLENCTVVVGRLVFYKWYSWTA